MHDILVERQPYHVSLELQTMPVFSCNNKSAAILCNKVEACVLQILFSEKLQNCYYLISPFAHSSRWDFVDNRVNGLRVDRLVTSRPFSASQHHVMGICNLFIPYGILNGLFTFADFACNFALS